jgi:hypothetical protein
MEEGKLTRRPGGTAVAWQGSAHAATMIPSQGKQPTTCRQEHHHTSTRRHHGEAEHLKKKLEVVHGRNPRCRRRRSHGHEEAIGKISRTGGCAVARSTRCALSRRLTPARVAGIEGDAAAIQSWELEREEEGRGAQRTDWPGQVRPSHPVWFDQVGWCPIGGARGLTSGLRKAFYQEANIRNTKKQRKL